MSCIVEIRSYNLKPGTRAEFHRLVSEQSMPMLQRWQVDVVAYGSSLHDEDSYYLMRSYASLEDRQQSQDAFYGGDEWRQGPREAILALIDTSTSVVIEVDEATLKGLRSQPAHPVE
jgi:NIPSNAP